jgi:hypothetical protein
MKVSLDLRVFNWLLSVDIKKSRIAEYEKAAYHAWNRYKLYYKYYKDSKTEHQIVLMTMLDISVQPFINYWSYEEEKISIELSVFDEKLKVTVNKKEQKLYEDAALFVTKRYSWYHKTYEKIKSEQEISRMALVDICIEKFMTSTPDETSENRSFSNVTVTKENQYE